MKKTMIAFLAAAFCFSLIVTLLAEYNADVFTANVTSIVVPEDNRLLFHLKDGRVLDRAWLDRSRASSWQPEMKEAARQRMLKQRRPC